MMRFTKKFDPTKDQTQRTFTAQELLNILEMVPPTTPVLIHDERDDGYALVVQEVTTGSLHMGVPVVHLNAGFD